MAFTSYEKAMQINDTGSLETADCPDAKLIERIAGESRLESDQEESDQ